MGDYIQVTRSPPKIPWRIKKVRGIEPWEVFYSKFGGIKDVDFWYNDFATLRNKRPVTVLYRPNQTDRRVGPVIPVEQGVFYPTVGLTIHSDNLTDTLRVLVNNTHDKFNVSWVDNTHQHFGRHIVKLATLHLQMNMEEVWIDIIISNAQFNTKLFIPVGLRCDVFLAVSSLKKNGYQLVDPSIAKLWETTALSSVLEGKSPIVGRGFTSWLIDTFARLEAIGTEILGELTALPVKRAFDGFGISTTELFLFVDAV